MSFVPGRPFDRWFEAGRPEIEPLGPGSEKEKRDRRTPPQEEVREWSYDPAPPAKKR